MAAKSFKGYGAMWSKPNETEKEEDKQAHDKSNKETPNNSFIQENKKARDNVNNKAHDNTFIPENKETPIKKRGRGRPKMDVNEKKKHFNLLLKPETIMALNTIAGRMQSETGQRVTTTGLITQLIDEFVAKQKAPGR